LGSFTNTLHKQIATTTDSQDDQEDSEFDTKKVYFTELQLVKLLPCVMCHSEALIDIK